MAKIQAAKASSNTATTVPKPPFKARPSSSAKLASSQPLSARRRTSNRAWRETSSTLTRLPKNHVSQAASNTAASAHSATAKWAVCCDKERVVLEKGVATAAGFRK